jgi:hypothetical protein
MKPSLLKRISTGAALLAAVSIATAASVQYIWINENGIKQYSDMPPPASVPKSRIVKEPGKGARHASDPAPETAAAPETSSTAFAKDKAPMTIAEKNADFQKRKIEQAEKEKKTADEAKLAADKAKNCDQARAYNRTLQSGVRLAYTDKNGERYYLSDAQRAQETQESKRTLDECK